MCFWLQVSYLIVDESEDDMVMYEDPFLKYGLPDNLRIDGKYNTKQKHKYEKRNSIRRVSVKQYNVNLQSAPDDVNYCNESEL